MTAPAPRNHPAEDAHPAPTPAPVAVEAYRYAQGMAVTERARGRQDEERAWLDLLHLLDQAAPRPEPVVAPLPSEAVRQALVDLLIKNRDRDYAASVYKFTPGKMADAILNAGYRLVPEDDEDTVRVPRDGAARIAAERQRQIEAEGWTRDHDAAHDGHDLVLAAVSYALPDTLRGSKRSQFYGSDDLGGDKVWVPMHWPWLGRFWKPTPRDRVRELEKAGALIAAEIDRLIGRPAL